MSKLQLFTTAGCHLCELAEQAIHNAGLSPDYQLELVEIGDNDQLVEQYGIRIPVLRSDKGHELNWPFDENAILAFLDMDARV
ncbi:MAG: glutaredoxin family protein [Methylophaga sp.]|nr:glutaredoxin family protein [Methylophaga sp.]